MKYLFSWSAMLYFLVFLLFHFCLSDLNCKGNEYLLTSKAVHKTLEDLEEDLPAPVSGPAS